MTPTHLHIIQTVCARVNVPWQQVLDKSKKPQTAFARNLCMYFLWHFTDLTKTAIGDIFKYDLTNINYGIKRINTLCKSSADTKEMVISLETELEQIFSAA